MMRDSGFLNGDHQLVVWRTLLVISEGLRLSTIHIMIAVAADREYL